MPPSKRTISGELPRLHVSLKRGNAMEISRISIGNEKLVYFLLADKKLDYAGGRSRVAYIGTTKNGISRVANSVAYRAPDVLRLRGVQGFSVRIVTCKPRQRVKTWVKLERAFLLAFKETYEEVPWCNSHGKSITEVDEFRYFSRSRLKRILDDLA